MVEYDTVHIEKVYPHGTNNFVVTYRNSLGERAELQVTASDEMSAYTYATKLIREQRVNGRVFMLCATIVMLGLFTVLGYSCSLPDQPSDMESCIQKGKQYVAVESVQDGTSTNTNITACK